MNKPKAFIFDLDFTLCHPVNRGPYGSGLTDEIIQPINHIMMGIVADHFMTMTDDKIHTLILSGRKNSDHLYETALWLKNNLIHYDGLYLNTSEPCTKAEVFKKEKLIELKERFNILGVFDDDPLVADVCMELGIPSFLFSYNN